MLDAYVTSIRQVATHLSYGEPHILEVFKNTLPTKSYWLLFPIDYLRKVVDTAKRILTKEKIDRQLAGQSSSTLFMSINGSYNNKRVTFDIQDGLEDKNRQINSIDESISNKGWWNKQTAQAPDISKQKERTE